MRGQKIKGKGQNWVNVSRNIITGSTCKCEKWYSKKGDKPTKLKSYFGVGLAVSCYKHSSATLISVANSSNI